MMAKLRDALEGVKNFSYSRTLFTNDDGSPMEFYAHHSVHSSDLNDIIRNGGGVLQNDTKTEESINLCNEGDKALIQEGFLPLKYIKKCVLEAVVINPNFYRCNVLGLSSREDDNVDEIDDDFDSTAANHTILVPSVSKGRSKYTDQDDFKILEHINIHRAFKKIKGNLLWKQMEANRVTSHTAQSMRSRFHKIILPNLDMYDLPPDLKSKLQGKWRRPWENDSGDDEEEGSGTEDQTINASVSKESAVIIEESENRNVIRDEVPSQPKILKKNTVIQVFDTKDSLCITNGIGKNFTISPEPLDDILEEQPLSPLQQKNERNDKTNGSLGFDCEDDEHPFYSVAEGEEASTQCQSETETVNFCNERETVGKEGINENLDLSTERLNASSVVLTTDSSDGDDQVQSVSEFQESEPPNLRPSGSIKRRSFVSNSLSDSSPLRCSKRRQLTSESNNLGSNQGENITGELLDKARKSTKLSTPKDKNQENKNVEYVSKEVTRSRIKAIKKFFKLGLEEAIEFLEENQQTLWPVIE